MPTILRPGQRAKITVANPVDKFGNPADLDGGIFWETTDESVLEIQSVPDDPMSVYAIHQRKGAAQVVISGDADLGDEVKRIQTAVDFFCQSGEAVGFAVSVGAPEDIEPAE